MKTVVTEKQKELAIEKADALTTLLRDGAVALLTGKSEPQEATPILDRLIDLLQAAGRDTDAILGDALERAQVLGMVGRQIKGKAETKGGNYENDMSSLR